MAPWESLATPIKREFFKKLRIQLPYDPAILLLGIYPPNLKTFMCKDICTPMFIAALVMVAKAWKQLKCPSIDDRIKKMWYIYTMGSYPATRRDEIPLFATTWMDLEIIMLSEISQKKLKTM